MQEFDRETGRFAGAHRDQSGNCVLSQREMLRLPRQTPEHCGCLIRSEGGDGSDSVLALHQLDRRVVRDLQHPRPEYIRFPMSHTQHRQVANCRVVVIEKGAQRFQIARRPPPARMGDHQSSQRHSSEVSVFSNGCELQKFTECFRTGLFAEDLRYVP